VDGYYNWLTNKIISAPSEADPYVWLPYNVGKVQALGADAFISVDFASGPWAFGANARYGWQQALDKTPDSSSFGQQIPYVARHTLSAGGHVGIYGWTLSCVYNLRAGRFDAAGQMPDWSTLDATFSKEFRLAGPLRLGFQLIGRNLLDRRYEVISGYPMPGRSLLGGLTFTF
jgi:outer membrane cobalamin receptor